MGLPPADTPRDAPATEPACPARPARTAHLQPAAHTPRIRPQTTTTAAAAAAAAMSTREQKLAAAKQKLERFQKSRTPGAYSIHNALASTTVNGQPIAGLGLVSGRSSAGSYPLDPSDPASGAPSSPTSAHRSYMNLASTRTRNGSRSSLRNEFDAAGDPSPSSSSAIFYGIGASPFSANAVPPGIPASVGGESASDYAGGSRATSPTGGRFVGVDMDAKSPTLTVWCCKTPRVTRLLSSHPTPRSSCHTPDSIKRRPSEVESVSGFSTASRRQDIPGVAGSAAGGVARRTSTQSASHEASKGYATELKRLNDLFKTRIEVLEAELDTLRLQRSTEIDSLGRQNEELKSALASAEAKSSELDKQFERDYEEVEENRMRTRLLEEDIQTLNRERESLEPSCALVRHAQQNMIIPHDERAPAMAALEMQLQEYQTMIDTLRQGAHEAHLQIAELNNAKSVLEETASIVEHEALEASMRQQLADLEGRLDQETKEREALLSEVARLTEAVAAGSAALLEVQQRLTDVEVRSQAEIDRLMAHIESLQEQLAQARAVSAASNSTASEKATPLTASSPLDRTAELERALEENRLLREQLQAQEYQIFDHLKSRQELGLKLDESLSLQTEYAGRLEEVTYQRNALQSSLDAVNLELAHVSERHLAETQWLHVKVEQLSSENERLEAQVHSLRNVAVVPSSSAPSASRGTATTATIAVAAVVDTMETGTATASLAVKSASTSPQASAPADTSVPAHSVQDQLLVKELEEERDALVARVSHLEAQARQSAQEHMSVVSNLQSSLQWVSDDKEGLVRDYEERVQELELKIVSLGAERDQVALRVRELMDSRPASPARSASPSPQTTAAIGQLYSELDAVKHELANTQTERDQLFSALQQVEFEHRATMTELEGKVAALQTALEGTQASLAKSDADLAEFRVHYDIVSAERDGLAERLLTSGSDAVPDSDDTDALRAEIATLSAERTGLQDQTVQLQDQVASLRKAIRDIEIRSSDDQNQLVDTMRNLTDVNKDFKAQSRSLRQTRLARSSPSPLPAGADPDADPFEAERVEYQQRIADLAGQISQFLARVMEREGEIERLRRETNRLEIELDAANKTIAANPPPSESVFSATVATRSVSVSPVFGATATRSVSVSPVFGFPPPPVPTRSAGVSPVFGAATVDTGSSPIGAGSFAPVSTPAAAAFPDDVMGLSARLQAAEAELADKMTQLALLEHQYQSLSLEHDYLRQEKQDSDERGEQLEAIIERNSGTYKDVLAKFEAERQVLTDHAAAFEAKALESEAALAKAEQARAESEERHANAREQLIKETQTQRDEIAAQIQTLSDELQSLEQRISDLTAERDALVAKTAEAEATSATASQAESDLVRQIEALQSDKQTLAAELSTTHDLARQWEEYAAQSLQDAQTVHDQERQAWESSVGGMRAELTTLVDKLKQADDRIEHMADAHATLLARNDELEAQVQAIKLQTQMSADSRFESLSETYQALLADKDVLEQRIVARADQAALDEKHAIEAELNESDARFQADLQEAVARSVQVEQRLHELEAQLAERRVAESDLLQQLDRERQDRSVLEHDNEAMTAQLHRALDDTVALQTQRDAALAEKAAVVEQQSMALEEQALAHEAAMAHVQADAQHLAAERDRLADTVAQLEDETESARRDALAAREEAARLAEQLSMASSATSNAVSSLEQRLEEAEHDLAAADAERLRLSKSLEETMSALALLQEETTGIQATRHMIDEERAALGQQIGHLTAELADIKAARDAAIEERTVLGQQVDQLTNDLSDAKAVIDEWQVYSSNLEAERDAWAAQRSDLESRLASISGSADQERALSDELARLMDEHNHVIDAKSAAEARVRELEAQVDEAGSALEAERRAHSDKLHEMQTRLDAAVDAEERLADVDQRYRELQESHVRVEADVHSLVAQLDEARSASQLLSQAESKLAAAMQECNQLHEQLQQLQVDVDRAAHDRDTALTTVAEREHALSMSETRVQQLEYDLGVARAEGDGVVTTLEAEKRDLVARLAAMEDEMEQLREQTRAAQAATVHYEGEMQALQSQRYELETRVHHAEDELRRVEAQHRSELEQIRLAHDEQAAAAKDSAAAAHAQEVEHVRAQLRDTEHQLESLRQQYDALDAQRNSEHHDRLRMEESLTADVYNTRAYAEDLARQIEALRGEQAASTETHQQQMHALEQQLAEAHETRHRMQHDLDTVHAQIEATRMSMTDSVDKLSGAEARTLQLQADYEAVAAKLSAAEQARTDLAGKLAETTDALSLKGRQLEEARGEAAKEQALSAALESQMADARRDLQAAETKIAALQRDIETHQKRVAETSATATVASIETAAKVERLTKEAAELREQVMVLTTERQALTESLARKSRQLDDTEQQLALATSAPSKTPASASGTAATTLNSMRSPPSARADPMDRLGGLANVAEVARLRATVADLESKLAETDQLLNDVQPMMDELDEKRNQVDRLSEIVRDLEMAASSNSAKYGASNEPSGHRLSNKEYAELTAKADDVDQSMSQLENCLALLDENAAEMDRQVDELRKVWSHELAANTVLRNLIAKTQGDAQLAQQESQRQVARLREEFDELAHAYDAAQREAELLRREAKTHDLALRSVEKRCDDRLNTQFYEHQEQLAAQDEQHIKERSALNKLVASLSPSATGRLEDRNHGNSREVDSLRRKLSERESQLVEIETSFRQAELKLRDADYRLKDYDAKFKELDMVHKDVMADLDLRLREAEMHARHVETKLKETEADYSRATQELNFTSERYRAMEDTYRQMTAPGHLHRTHEELDAQRQAWLAERVQLEMQVKQKQMELLDREQDLLEERMRMRSLADEEIRNAVSTEQRLRAKYENVIDDLRAQKRKVQEQLDETEHRAMDAAERERALTDEAKALAHRLGERETLWRSERERLEQELARIRDESVQITEHLKADDANGVVSAIQEQKDNLDALLRDRESEIGSLQAKMQELSSVQVETVQREKNLMRMLTERDRQLRESQAQLQAMTIRIDQLSGPAHRDQQTSMSWHRRLHPTPLLAAAVTESQLEEARRQAETQIRFERDRAKRLAHKVEDLKYRNTQLKKQIEARAAPMPSSIDGAREEIEALRTELANLKTSNGEVLAVLRETLLNTVGPGAIDIPDIESNREVVYMRALTNRLVLWRADLKYQKLYLSLKVEDLLESHKTTLSFIHGMGVTLDRQDSMSNLTPRRKFIRCVHAVIAMQRMRVLATSWQLFLQDTNRVGFEDGFRDSDRDLASGVVTAAGVSRDHLGAYAASTYRLATTSNMELQGGDQAQSQAQSHRTADLEHKLAALEDRLNEEMYERRAVELENERLLRAVKYDRQPQSGPSLPPVGLGSYASDRMSPVAAPLPHPSTLCLLSETQKANQASLAISVKARQSAPSIFCRVCAFKSQDEQAAMGVTCSCLESVDGPVAKAAQSMSRWRDIASKFGRRKTAAPAATMPSASTDAAAPSVQSTVRVAFKDDTIETGGHDLPARAAKIECQGQPTASLDAAQTATRAVVLYVPPIWPSLSMDADAPSDAKQEAFTHHEPIATNDGYDASREMADIPSACLAPNGIVVVFKPPLWPTPPTAVAPAHAPAPAPAPATTAIPTTAPATVAVAVALSSVDAPIPTLAAQAAVLGRSVVAGFDALPETLRHDVPCQDIGGPESSTGTPSTLETDCQELETALNDYEPTQVVHLIGHKERGCTTLPCATAGSICSTFHARSVLGGWRSSLAALASSSTWPTTTASACCSTAGKHQGYRSRSTIGLGGVVEMLHAAGRGMLSGGIGARGGSQRPRHGVWLVTHPTESAHDVHWMQHGAMATARPQFLRQRLSRGVCQTRWTMQPCIEPQDAPAAARKRSQVLLPCHGLGAYNCNLSIVKFLHSERQEGCTKMFSEVAISTSAKDSGIHIWDIRNGALLSSLKGNSSAVNSTALVPAYAGLYTPAPPTNLATGWLLPSLILSAQNDRAALHAWSFAKAQPVGKFVVPERLSCVVVSNSGRFCAAGGVSGRLYLWEVWDLATGTPLLTVLFPRPLTCLQVNVLETVIYVGCSDGTTRAVDMYRAHDGSLHAINEGDVHDAGTEPRIFRGHTAAVTCLSLSMDESHLVSGSEDGDCIVWDASTRQPLRTFKGHKDPVTSVKVILKPSAVGNPDVQTRVAIEPFKRFPAPRRDITTADGEVNGDAAWNVSVLPTQGRDRLNDQIDDVPFADAAQIFAGISAGMVGAAKAGESHEDEVNALHARIALLEKHNSELRQLNDELFNSARTQLEETAQVWTKQSKDLNSLKDMLDSSAPATASLSWQVPIGTGNLAFMPGELYHTNEVMVSLGANWFAETSLVNARRIMQDRLKFADAEEQIEAGQLALKDLELREQMMSGAIPGHDLDKEGDEVNEEGLKFVEITEEYDEEAAKQAKQLAHRKVHFEDEQEQEQESQPEPAVDNSEHLGDFERSLLEKIRRLELEEDNENSDDDEIRVDEDDIADTNDDDDDIVDSDDEDGSNSQQHTTESQATGRTAEAGRQQAAPPLAPAPVKATVVERSFDDHPESEHDEDSSDTDIDDLMMGPQVSVAYHRKRQQFLSAGLLRPAVGHGKDEEYEEYEEDENEAEDEAGALPTRLESVIASTSLATAKPIAKPIIKPGGKPIATPAMTQAVKSAATPIAVPLNKPVGVPSASPSADQSSSRLNLRHSASQKPWPLKHKRTTRRQETKVHQ
ncbi:hypothetical protein BC831DRAFT_433920 [Entophlyctis helioformis]|nr:hypothetical protein BC831DRAFT_433920 [Entophlyctis helioformis]